MTLTITLVDLLVYTGFFLVYSILGMLWFMRQPGLWMTIIKHTDQPLALVVTVNLVILTWPWWCLKQIRYDKKEAKTKKQKDKEAL